MTTPYELLLGMSLLREKQAHIQAYQTAYQGVHDALAGAAFLRIRLAQQTFLILQDEVKEVMPILKIAEVTPAQTWLFGFASYKGDLLPVIDMKRLPKFLSNNDTQSSAAAVAAQPYPSSSHDYYRQTRTDNVRILVLKGVEGLLGIYVDAVLGIQHYWLHTETDEQTNAWCQAWVKIEDKQQNSEVLPVLNMQKIIQYCHVARH